MKTKAIIFDLDGVLTDSAKYHYLAWKTLSEELGLTFNKEINERLKGVSRMDSFQIILEVNHAEDRFSVQEKEKLIEKQYEKEEAPQQDQKEEKVFKQEVSQNIIEKPNYDFIQESDKGVKLSRKENAKKKPRKKRLSLFLSIALGISAIICVSNVIAIDQMSSNLAGIEYELYEVNLPKYLKDIADLDTTKKGMEFIETFPEEEFDAGEAGKKSNWFDKLCNFFSGLFGG